MKNPLSQIALTLGLGVACTLSIITPSLAQYQQETNDANFQSNEKDSLYGDSTLGVNPMDLIHNYNLSVGRNAEEFREESGTQIQNSAEEFRRMQQEQILQQYNTTPDATGNTVE